MSETHDGHRNVFVTTMLISYIYMHNIYMFIRIKIYMSIL